jgi:hypothetical protein
MTGNLIVKRKKGLDHKHVADREYSSQVGPYIKGPMVAKRKKPKKGPVPIGDARMYGELDAKEASVMYEVYEDGGFDKGSLAAAESLRKKGFVTYKINTVSNGRDYEGKVTDKGKKWIRKYEDGEFDHAISMSDSEKGGAATPAQLEKYNNEIRWGTEKKTGFSQGWAINHVIKTYDIPAVEWGYSPSGAIGVGTKTQRMVWKDKGMSLEFQGIVKK